MPVVKRNYKPHRTKGKKITSRHIKTALLHYFRYQRQQVVATEVQSLGGIADVLTTYGDEIAEVEIKISLSDLKKEFVDKKGKHRDLGACPSYALKHCPSYFYFCIPEKLIEPTQDLIEIHNKNYGIILYNPDNYYWMTRPQQAIQIIRKAKKLLDKPGEYLKNYIIKRATSELCHFYYKIYGQEIFTNDHEDQLYFNEYEETLAKN